MASRNLEFKSKSPVTGSIGHPARIMTLASPGSVIA
jgi:hypothetical protein